MSAALRRMTLEEFLAWEEQQPVKWEFDGFGPVPWGDDPQGMAGASFVHSVIQANLIVAAGSRLRGTGCRVFGSDLKVNVAGAVRYPDAGVICGPVLGNPSSVSTPVALFEILSDSTQRKDRGEKMREYMSTESVQRYVLLEQDRIMATVWTRDGDEWTGRVHYEGETLHMPELGIAVPLDELYLDVELPERRG